MVKVLGFEVLDLGCRVKGVELTSSTESIEVRLADSNRVRTKGQGLKYVGAALDPTVHDHLRV